MHFEMASLCFSLDICTRPSLAYLRYRVEISTLKNGSTYFKEALYFRAQVTLLIISFVFSTNSIIQTFSKECVMKKNIFLFLNPNICCTGSFEHQNITLKLMGKNIYNLFHIVLCIFGLQRCCSIVNFQIFVASLADVQED